ncbi:hypothetical protein LEP1GSC204_1488 [Leptospira interrogans serovar Copenhageni str. M20]|nr:hypothetical protein AMR47_07595 [Leptospira interrogans]EKP22580.1 hypothetical protein LEP1GSC117_4364 [Leptospira interrogans serovar Icterohaemorrhagiae str. Verdun LP]EMY55485.1 hypothetical protein LEP1GSC204_1488 [Leptospira interrogans serovar Copenhageni str. M20]
MKNPFSILFLFYVTQSVETTINLYFTVKSSNVGTTTFKDFAVKFLKVRNCLELVSKNKCRNSTF